MADFGGRGAGLDHFQDVVDMTPCYQEDGITIHEGDCLTVLPLLPPESVHAIVTDPPYGLSFMGREWDYDVPDAEVWRECLRVLKPGGHLLAFSGTRTYHRAVVAIEDAGFEIRDMIGWIYGSGFPKSLDVGKAIDKASNVEFREVPSGGVGFMNPEGSGGTIQQCIDLKRLGSLPKPQRSGPDGGPDSSPPTSRSA